MRILLSASTKELLRDRQSLFWALVFPVMILVLFSLFSLDRSSRTELVVAGASSAAEFELVAALDDVEALEIERRPALSEAAALELLEDDEADAVLLFGEADPGSAVLLYPGDDEIDISRLIAVVRSVVDGLNIEAAEQERMMTLLPRASGTEEEDFFDFLAPGVLGMALMMFGVISMAASLARYRELGVLRRMRATPLPPWRFFAGMAGGYLAIGVIQVVVLVVVARALGAGEILTGLPAVALLLLLGTALFLNLGVIVAGFVRGVYAAEAAANAITMPMMFLSGTFFPVDSLPRGVELAVQLLPLTHLLRALRAVSLDGEPLWEQAPEIGVLLLWLAGTFWLARRLFHLEDA